MTKRNRDRQSLCGNSRLARTLTRGGLHRTDCISGGIKPPAVRLRAADVFTQTRQGAEQVSLKLSNDSYGAASTN
jgi:hypothetical protein